MFCRVTLEAYGPTRAVAVYMLRQFEFLMLVVLVLIILLY